MSCDWRRRKAWAQVAEDTGLTAVELETTFLQAKQAAVEHPPRLSPAERAELAAQTLALFGYLRSLGVQEMPMHGQQGLPRRSSQVGFAAVWEHLLHSLTKPTGDLEVLTMSKPEIIEALRLLDRRLSAPMTAIVAGGAAMILHFGSKRNTHDVDVLMQAGHFAQLRRFVRDVAQERGIPEDWMSDEVKGYADMLPPDYAQRLEPLGEFGFRHLRLWALGRPEQVAMKLASLRERDLVDLNLLLPAMTAAEKQVLIANVHRVSHIRGDWAQRMRYYLEEQGWEIG